VVLQRVPLTSLKEEFLIPERKFIPGRNWRGQTVGEKKLPFLLFFYLTHNKLYNEVGLLDGNVYSMQGQVVLTAVTDVIK